MRKLLFYILLVVSAVSCMPKDHDGFVGGSFEIEDLDSVPKWQGNGPNYVDSLPSGRVANPGIVKKDDAVYYFGGHRKDGLTDKVWCYRTEPIDGYKKKGWMRLADMPVKIPKAKVIAIGQSHVLVMGKETAWAYHSIT
ncbi:MAG: hypothetical protein ACPGLV_17400, partial [Bacteroidia bacterium]